MYKKIALWVSAPAYPDDHEKSRAALVLNIVLWMFIGASAVYGFFAPIEPQFRMRRMVIIIPFVLVLLVLKQILNRGHVRAVGILVVFSAWLTFTAAMLFGADYKNPAYMGYLIVVVTAGLVLNWRAAIGWGVLSILTNAVILTLGICGVLPLSQNETPPFAFWAAQTVYILVATVLLSQTTRRVDEALEKARHEIRERRRMEAEREDFIRELEIKNAELERFIYAVSHDLKSPLITISGYLGYLEKDVLDNDMEKFGADLKRIRDAAGKMQALIHDLLELSRLGRFVNPFEKVPFQEIVREAMAIVDIQLKNKNVRVQVQPDLPAVYVDRPRMVEVMQNLLENAAKFMGDQPQPLVEIGAREADGAVVFYVKDNGVGIHPKHFERIFGLFNKLDPNTEGTGIGLALVKRTIEIHGGRIWVESQPGEGTTFYFTLPQEPR